MQDFFYYRLQFFFSGVWRPVDRPLPHQPIQGQGSRIQGLCQCLISYYTFFCRKDAVSRDFPAFFLFIRLVVYYQYFFIFDTFCISNYMCSLSSTIFQRITLGFKLSTAWPYSAESVNIEKFVAKIRFEGWKNWKNGNIL